MKKEPTKVDQKERHHYGFVQVPRIVRKSYKELTGLEKWLYVCLRDLCGEQGTCFRTIRVLQEETGLSLGSLSTMIRHLHSVGLIHAEKKRRTTHGKEVWHITIVDIWELNDHFLAEEKKQRDCSIDEQKPEVQSRIVQPMNDNVQSLNNVVQPLNDDESELSVDCSKTGDRIRRGNDNPVRENERKDNSLLPNGKKENFPSFIQSSPSEKSPSQKEATPKEKKPTFTPTELAILEWWDEVQPLSPSRTARRTTKPLAILAKLIDQGQVTLEVLKQARTHMINRKNSFCRDNPLTLYLFEDQLEGALIELQPTLWSFNGKPIYALNKEEFEEWRLFCLEHNLNIESDQFVPDEYPQWQYDIILRQEQERNEVAS